MGECLRAEARVLNLDRTPWHMTWGGVRPQRARRKADGARVSARELRAEPYPTFRRRAPRHGCQPCLRGSRLSSRVPSALSLSASRLGGTHSRRGQSGLRERVGRRRRLRRGGCVRSDDGTTTALHRRPGKEGPARVPRNRRSFPLPRPEQRRVEGSPLIRGRRDHCADSKLPHFGWCSPQHLGCSPSDPTPGAGVGAGRHT